MKARTRLLLGLLWIAFCMGFVIGWTSVAPNYAPLWFVLACVAIFITVSGAIALRIFKI